MKFFGTDGIRGKFGSEFINEEFFRKLANATEKYFSEFYGKNELSLCIGRDTRESGEILANAFISGLSENARVLDCGILPTPAVAEATIFSESDIGIVITASHNQYTDNGIKIFNARGEKLTINQELGIEAIIDSLENIRTRTRYETIKFHDKAKNNYCNKYSNALPKGCLSGKTIILDSANGATYDVAKIIFDNFGANVVHIGNIPNGKNINENCGSEHPENLLSTIKKTDAFIGIANDGDGDRVIIFDEHGDKVSGDALLGIIANHMAETNSLPNKTIVTTLQSNLGLDKYLNSIGIDVIRCDIGDRNVYQAIVENDCYFGGENSGHLIFRQFSPIGDGITAAIYTISILIKTGAKLSDLKTKIALFPQKSFNVLVKNKVPISEINHLADDIEEIDSKLPSPHRVLVRYSGTEPKLRVLVESPDQISVDHAWQGLKDVITKRLTENGISSSII